MNYVAIMAGGVGSRFWPSSRESMPKQFLDIMGVGQSLLQMTFQRAKRMVPTENVYILTNSKYVDLILEQLPELKRNQILCEPSRNNTAPCITYMGLKLHLLDKDANFAVLPSDHLILKEDEFISKMEAAFAFTAENDAIVTLGLAPIRPDTGYGYIEYEKASEDGVHAVKRFVEKPDLATAQSYLAHGGYLWNAGIFIWKAATLLNGIKSFEPSIYDMLYAGHQQMNTDQEQAFIDQAYPNTPNISIDYALLERAKNIYTIPAEIGWSDLGTWASLYAEHTPDANGNVVVQSKQMLLNTSNTLVRAPQNKLVVVKDLDDYMIIDTDDVLLIYPKNKEQEIKAITAEVKKLFGEDYL